MVYTDSMLHVQTIPTETKKEAHNMINNNQLQLKNNEFGNQSFPRVGPA